MHDPYPVIVAYSMLQLPQTSDKRVCIYKKLKTFKKDLHFACENKAIVAHDLIESIRSVELMICCYDATIGSRISFK